MALSQNLASHPPTATRSAGAARGLASLSFRRLEEPDGGFDAELARDSGGRTGGARILARRDHRLPVADYAFYARVIHLDEVIFANTQALDPRPSLFPAEVLAGIERYEANLRIISVIDHPFDESYNRLF